MAHCQTGLSYSHRRVNEAGIAVKSGEDSNRGRTWEAKRQILRQRARRVWRAAERSALERPGTTEQRRLQERVVELERQVRQLSDLAGLAQSAPGQVSARFYQDLEDTHRGSTDEVRQLLRPHLDRALAAPGPVVDLGCGRGDWLGLLREYGQEAIGVDLNEEALEEARAQELDVRRGDALAFLRNLPDNSVGAVTAFHLIEHVDFSVVIELLEEAVRAIAPGGFVLFETPDCRNVLVGATAFWLDPTHLKPVHPDLLAFAFERTGLVDVEILGLHPSRDELDHATLDSLADDPARNGVLTTVAAAVFAPRDVAVSGVVASDAPAPPDASGLTDPPDPS